MSSLPILSPDDWAEQMLLPHHLRMLEIDRAISRSVILARRTRSAEDGIDLLDLGLTPYPTPGLLIPIYPAATLPGDAQTIVYRPDNPVDPKRKYFWPAGQRARIDVPPLARAMLSDPSQIVYVVEGWLKADSLVSAGLCAIALLGTSAFGWKPEPGLPILHDWEAIPKAGRLFRIIFDSDTPRKEGVLTSLMRLTTLIRTYGAEVEWVMLPDAADGAKLGADDWRALGHDVKEFEGMIELPGREPYVTAPLDDIGNAERFVYGNADRAKWCYEQKVWYSWDGRRWDATNQERVMGFAHETAREAQIAAARLPTNHANRDAIINFLRRLGSSSALNNMLAHARDAMSCSAAVFDNNPMMLTCANGTIDLTSGSLLRHDPDDHITKMSPAIYKPGAKLPEWDTFLQATTEGKPGLAEFIQVALGYSTTGDTREERLFMPIGKTRTGKSTLVEAVAKTLGDYAATANFETFVKKANEGIREDVARLRGARFVSAIEVEEGKHLADAIVKQLTGGDTITARLLYQNSSEFVPQLKLWLVANEEPTVNEDNEAMWERILRLPFDQYVPEDERDRGLKGRLKDPSYAGSAILEYLVQGALTWQAEGLRVPECVRSATKAYKERMAPLTHWLEDDCIVSEAGLYPVSDAFPAYVAWAKRNAIDTRERLRRTNFNRAMVEQGFVQERATTGTKLRYWQGLSERPYTNEESQNGRGDDPMFNTYAKRA